MQKTDLDRVRQKISVGFYEGLCLSVDFLFKTTKPFVKQHLRHRLKRPFEKFIIKFTNFVFFLWPTRFSNWSSSVNKIADNFIEIRSIVGDFFRPKHSFAQDAS